MDFSTAYFGKPLLSLEYIDIVNYFLETRQETENIEFKSYPERATFDAGLQNAIRGISAFLNSAGGILIWGSPKGTKQEGKSEEVFFGELCTVKELKEKDSLINKISSAITPLPIGITVQILSSGSNYIYIFEIQPSIYKPHQYDTRYYVRLDGQTKPAPHYLIEALIKQISYPNINGVIKFHSMKLEYSILKLPITIGIFNFSEFQNEEDVSFRLLCVGGYFSRSDENSVIKNKWHYANYGQELIYENFAPILHFETPKIFDELILIEDSKVEANNGKLTLLLSFEGKSSPAKTSHYILNLSGNFGLSNPNSRIETFEENILFSERQKQLNKTSKDTLNHFTSRG